MSLEVSKLENVSIRGGKTIARCPACGEAGHDQKGEHLVINEDGSFGCVVYSGDSAGAKAHRKRIFALCGDCKILPLAVHPVGVGRLGRVNQSQAAVHPLKTGLLGRLGRAFQTHLEKERAQEGKEHRITEKLNDFREGVLSVLSTPAVKSHKPQLRSVLGLRFCMVYSEALEETIFFAEDEPTKTALVEAGADPWSIYTKDELRVLVAQNRAKPFLPDELCKLHKLKRTFHGRITT